MRVSIKRPISTYRLLSIIVLTLLIGLIFQRTSLNNLSFKNIFSAKEQSLIHQNAILLQTSERGQVTEILVHEGQMVDKNQLLLYIQANKKESLHSNDDFELELMLQTKLNRLNALINNQLFSPTEHFQKGMGDNIKMEEALFQFQQTELNALKTRQMLLEKEILITEPLVKKGIISQLEFIRLQQSLNELKQTISHTQASFINEAMQLRKELAQIQETNSTRKSIVAPIKGMVKKMLISTGSKVDVGSNLIKIQPLP